MTAVPQMGFDMEAIQKIESSLTGLSAPMSVRPAREVARIPVLSPTSVTTHESSPDWTRSAANDWSFC